MRGLHVRAGSVELRGDLPSLAPSERETRVRVLVAGICATDLALARGYMGFAGVPGHEFVGVALDGPLAGRRVVGEINAGCGRCAACASGLARHCRARSVLGIHGRAGAFAEELALPAENLHALPDALRDDEAVFAEPLAAAFEVAERVRLAPGERALVLGDGKLGLLCAQVLALQGMTVDVAGRHAERAPLLHGFARHLGPPENAAEKGYDVVVEATGDPSALSIAVARARPRGTVVLKTTSERPAALDLAPLVVDEIALVGSRCGRFEPALDALAARRVRVSPLVAARFPLEQALRAFERAGQRGTLKVLIDVGGA